MNIIEFLLKDNMVLDEYGNAYVELTSSNFCESYFPFKQMIDLGNGDLFITKEELEQIKSVNIMIEDDVDFPDWVRRPYYRMRGKPVTEEQAFEIIRRTDNYGGCDLAVYKQKDYIGSINFDNWLINKYHFPYGYGWVHVDGTIGGNAITQKYPTLEEAVVEWCEKLWAFPYLDLIIALTWWNESPSDAEWNAGTMGYDFETETGDSKFCENVMCGIWVHDKQVEVLRAEKAVQKYKEYDILYGRPREKFFSWYYEKNGITQINLEYLKRCFEAYGLDADKEIDKVGGYRKDE